jgi:hypothetical protein
MLLGYIYSLDNNINFHIYSRDANFGYNKGWKDYFEPFTKEELWNYHHKYNYRTTDEFNYFKTNKLIRKINFWKAITNTDFLTFDIFDKIRSKAFQNKKFQLKEFPKANDLKTLFSKLITKTWVYNKTTNSSIQELINNLHLPNNYNGIHIRSGDKKNEFNLFSVHEYIKKVKELSNNRNLFIATDDYENINQIKKSYPEFNCFFLCEEAKKGYDQKVFEKQNKTIIKNEMIELFATTDILTKADYFIGTYSSNIGTYISSRRNYINSYALDFEEWRVW